MFALDYGRLMGDPFYSVIRSKPDGVLSEIFTLSGSSPTPSPMLS